MMRGRRAASIVLLHALLIVAAAISVMPIAWTFCAAFKQGDDLYASTFLPIENGCPVFNRLTLNNFSRLFTGRPVWMWTVNALFVASTQTLIVVFTSSLAGFALAKYQFRGKRVLLAAMIVTVLLPAQVLLPSLYELMDRLGLVNRFAGLIVPAAVSVVGMFLFRQSMRGVPDDLLFAARIDGASEFRLWWSVAMPCVRPMIAAFSLLSFLSTWNSLLWPQLMLKDEQMFTLPVGLSTLSTLPEFQADYGVLMAGTIAGVLPPVLLFLLCQREFVNGLIDGAING